VENVEGLGLAPDRERYNIAQIRSVEIRVGVVQPDFPNSPVEGWLHCLTCDDVMVYQEDRELFECQGCGYTVSRTEAGDLCVAHTDYVKKLSTSFMPPPPREEKKKRRWYLLWLW
jgi:hypothetical protein